MVYLGSERSDDLLSIPLSEGSIIPIEPTALGHAYLAGLDEKPRADLMWALREHAPDRMRESRPVIEGNIKLFREKGYCIVSGLWHPHVCAVGVPFRPTDGTATLAFSCGGLSHYAPEQRLHDEIGPRLVELVDRVRKVLDGNTAAVRPSKRVP